MTPHEPYGDVVFFFCCCFLCLSLQTPLGASTEPALGGLENVTRVSIESNEHEIGKNVQFWVNYPFKEPSCI